VSSDAMWAEASRDVEAEANERALAMARVALAGTWPFLAAAGSVEEYTGRKALAHARISTALAEVVGSDPGTVEALYQQVMAGLDADFATHLAAKRAQAAAAQAEQAAKAITAALRAQAIGTQVWMCKVCSEAIQSEGGSWEHVDGSKDHQAIGLDGGRAPGYTWRSSTLVKGTEATLSTQSHTDGDIYTGGPCHVQGCDGTVKLTADPKSNPLTGVKRYKCDGCGAEYRGPKESSLQAHTASTYCPNHGVYVGEGNAERHDHCKTEQRKTKDSSLHPGSRLPFAREVTAAEDDGLEDLTAEDLDAVEASLSEASLHTADNEAPYNIEQRGSKWVVVNTKGDVKGTFDSKDEARQQQKALYANVPGAREKAEKKSGSRRSARLAGTSALVDDPDYDRGYQHGYHGLAMTSGASAAYLAGFEDGQGDYDMDYDMTFGAGLKAVACRKCTAGHTPDGAACAYCDGRGSLDPTLAMIKAADGWEQGITAEAFIEAVNENASGAARYEDVPAPTRPGWVHDAWDEGKAPQEILDEGRIMSPSANPVSPSLVRADQDTRIQSEIDEAIRSTSTMHTQANPYTPGTNPYRSDGPGNPGTDFGSGGGADADERGDFQDAGPTQPTTTRPRTKPTGPAGAPEYDRDPEDTSFANPNAGRGRVDQQAAPDSADRTLSHLRETDRAFTDPPSASASLAARVAARLEQMTQAVLATNKIERTAALAVAADTLRQFPGMLGAKTADRVPVRDYEWAIDDYVRRDQEAIAAEQERLQRAQRHTHPKEVPA
jgi:rubrerythrin